MQQTNKETGTGICTGPEKDQLSCLLLLLDVSTSLSRLFKLALSHHFRIYFTPNWYSSPFLKLHIHIDLQDMMIMSQIYECGVQNLQIKTRSVLNTLHMPGKYQS